MERFETLHKVINNKLTSTDYLEWYMLHLLIHRQKQLVLNIFSIIPGIKERFWPIYYATIKLDNSNDIELKKMPPEFTETVDDILNHIKERQQFYYS